MDKFTNNWLYPRDIQAVVSYLEIILENKKNIYLYGGGSLTKEILGKLPAQVKKNIKGIIDQNHSTITYDLEVTDIESFVKNKNKYDAIVLCHYDWETMFLDRLRIYRVPDQYIVPIFSSPTFSDFIELDDFYRQCEYDKSKKVCIFITLKNQTKILDDLFLASLPRDDYIYARIDMSRDYVAFDGTYDIEINAYRSLILLCQYITTLKPKVIHIHDQIETLYFLPRYLKERFPDIVLVWEPYDLVSHCLPSPSVFAESKGLLTDQNNWFFENEKYNIKNVDMILHKEIGGIEGVLGRRQIEYDFVVETDKFVLPEISEKVRTRLVFTGSVFNSRDTDKFNQTSHLLNDFFQIVRNINVSVDLYLNSGRDKWNTFYENYVELDKAKKNFCIRERVEENELIAVLPEKYGWGLILLHCPNGKIDETLAAKTYARKMTTYLKAGLPVVVTKQAEGMAEIVERNGLGLVVAWEDHGQLGDMITDLSAKKYQEFRNNVQNYVLRHDVSSVVSRYCDDVLNK